MTWTEEVHTQRVLAEQRKVRLVRKGVACEEKGTANVGPIVLVAGAAALTALYRKEGHRINGKQLEGVPLVGGWLAQQLKSWKREPPRVMASKAALARSQSSAKGSKAAAKPKSTSTTQAAPKPVAKPPETAESSPGKAWPAAPVKPEPAPATLPTPLAAKTSVVMPTPVVTPAPVDPPTPEAAPMAPPPTLPPIQATVVKPADPAENASSGPAPTAIAPAPPSVTFQAVGPATPRSLSPDSGDGSDGKSPDAGAKPLGTRLSVERRPSFTGTPKSKFINVVFPPTEPFRGAPSRTSSTSITPPSPPNAISRGSAAKTLAGVAEALSCTAADTDAVRDNGSAAGNESADAAQQAEADMRPKTPATGSGHADGAASDGEVGHHADDGPWGPVDGSAGTNKAGGKKKRNRGGKKGKK